MPTENGLGLPIARLMGSEKELQFRWVRKPEIGKPGDGLFSVLITGDLLKECHILDGDFAICRVADGIEYDGQLAAVLIYNCLTVKCVHEDGEAFVLQGCGNPAKFLRADRADAIVVGVVIRIERDITQPAPTEFENVVPIFGGKYARS